MTLCPRGHDDAVLDDAVLVVVAIVPIDPPAGTMARIGSVDASIEIGLRRMAMGMLSIDASMDASIGSIAIAVIPVGLPIRVVNVLVPMTMRPLTRCPNLDSDSLFLEGIKPCVMRGRVARHRDIHSGIHSGIRHSGIRQSGLSIRGGRHDGGEDDCRQNWEKTLLHINLLEIRVTMGCAFLTQLCSLKLSLT